MADYHRLTPEQLVAFATNMFTVLGNDERNLYGVPAAQVTTLHTDTTDLTSAVNAVIATKAAQHNAVVTKAAKDKALLAAISQVAKTCYANAAVTNAMLASIGLTARSKPHVVTGLTAPSELLATPEVDGTVILKWKANGNSGATSYVIEEQSGEGEWTFVTAQTARRAKLDGYAPGTTVNFRVRAAKAGSLSAPSNVTMIYPANSPATVQLHAA